MRERGDDVLKLGLLRRDAPRGELGFDLSEPDLGV